MKLMVTTPMNMYFVLVVYVLTLLPHATKAESFLGFQYDDVTACSSSVVEMKQLSFDCNSGDGCTFGDEVTITGQFTTTLPIPGEVNIKIQICKFGGTLCTPYLADTNVDVCGFLGSRRLDEDGDGGYYCASEGTYDYQTTFTLPENTLSGTNFAINGVTFRIYVWINNDFSCHAQFTTIKSEGYTSTGYSFLGAVALIASGCSMYEIRKRRRRTLAQVDLQAEEEKGSKRKVRFDVDDDDDHYVTL